MPSEKILNAKKEQVKNLAEKFKKAKMIVFSDYRGINVEDDTKLRAEIRKNECEYMVVKNSIISHAAKEAGIEGLDEILEGPTSVAIGYDDYIVPAKVVNNYAKGSDFYKIKAGVMDQKMIDVKEVKKLKKKVEKEMLLAAKKLNFNKADKFKEKLDYLNNFIGKM